MMAKLSRQVQGRLHRPFIRPVLASQVKSRSMVRRSSYKGKPYRKVHGFIKSDGLERGKPLIVMHKYGRIILASARFIKEGVSRERAVDQHPFSPHGADGRHYLFPFFLSEFTAMAMNSERKNGNRDS